MKIWRILAVWLLVGTSALAWQFRSATRASLELDATAARPGDTITAAVRLQMDEGWHTYWTNPGTGLPTEIEWKLPEGVTAGPLQWPTPEKYLDSVSGGYVYHNEVYLLAPLTISRDVKPGKLTLGGKVSWLECKTSCIPGDADVTATLIVGTEKTPSSKFPIFEEWRKRIPTKSSDIVVKAVWGAVGEDKKRSVVIEWKSSNELPSPDFYPFSSEDFELDPETETASSEGGAVLRKTLSKFGDNWPSEIRGVLVADAANSRGTDSYEVTIPVGEAVAVVETAALVPKGGVRELSLAKVLLFAFLGGLILNIMPCVLPVIALKILGFVNQSKEEPGRIKTLGLVYTLGVLFSFLAMALVIIAVQQAGRAASWGMQFSNPIFLVGLTVLVTLVALNLFGVFEVTLGGGAMTAAGGLASKKGKIGAFFNGILATTLATPCTAPFLAPALGFAFVQPPAIIVLVFLTVGAGLAFPYLLLSWKPEWLKYLPKPGAWMERFKVAMGFPMLGTAVWLFWLCMNHFDDSGTLWLGLFLVSVALSVWIYGEFVQRGRQRRRIAIGVAVVVLIGSYWFNLEKQLQWRVAKKPSIATVQDGGIVNDPTKIDWQPWSPEAVAAARKDGRPVFVDFTADWCPTCKVNKAIAVEIDDVRKKLREINAVALIADNTLSPQSIALELRRYGRAGVPLNLVYPAEAGAEPIVLPTALTRGIVLEALGKVAALPKTSLK